MAVLTLLTRQGCQVMPLSLRTAGGYVAQGEFASSLPWCFWTAGGFFSFTKMLCWTCFSKSDNYLKDFLVAQRVKNLPAMQGTQVRSLGQEDPLEK